MRIFVSILIGFLSGTALADQSHQPEPTDIKMVREGLLEALHEPKDLKLADIDWGVDPSSTSALTTLCGSYSASYDRTHYSAPAPFFALLGNDPLTGDRTIHLLKAANTADQARLAKRVCEERISFSREVWTQGEKVADLFQQQSKAALGCLLDGQSSALCDESEALLIGLRSNGWCPRQDGIVAWKSC